jgi:hypothetical protein
MVTINNGSAVEALWEAMGWESINPDEIFDQISSKLNRHPRFKGLSITEIDLLLADLRRQFVHEVHEYQWRLVQAFKRELEFAEQDTAA